MGRVAVRFTRLRLSNWRNFKQVDLPFRDRVFVVGPNAAGKSNLLDALRFLRDIAAPGGSLVRATSERGGVSHLRSLHAGQKSAVRIDVELVTGNDPDRWVYALEISGSESRGGALRIVREVVRHGDVEVLSRPRPEDRNDLLLTQTHLEQVSQSLAFRPLADALASIIHVHVVPQVARTAIRAEELSRTEAPGSDFIDQIARLTERQQQRSLARIEKLLQIAVPQFSQLEIERDKLGRPHLKAKYKHWRPRGGWQNERDFSDGTLRLIGLFWAIGQGDTPLLLEEPELSLHRAIIQQLPRLFARATERSGRQVFICTHAEEMLNDRGIDPAEIIVLHPSDQETKAVLGSEDRALVGAVDAKLPLGPQITARTRPKNAEQLAFQWTERAR